MRTKKSHKEAWYWKHQVLKVFIENSSWTIMIVYKGNLGKLTWIWLLNFLSASIFSFCQGIWSGETIKVHVQRCSRFTHCKNNQWSTLRNEKKLNNLKQKVYWRRAKDVTSGNMQNGIKSNIIWDLLERKLTQVHWSRLAFLIF